MKSEKKLKEYETIWTCNFCGEEFKTKTESDKHELTCKQNKIKQNLFWIIIVLLGIYFLTYFISNSYAQSNGLSTKNLLQPQKWFSSEVKKEDKKTTNQKPSSSVVSLQDTNYNGKVFTGSISNKNDKPIFNTKISLRISKDHSSWNIDEQHDFIVPYKIDPGQTINFSENYKTNKTNPWWTSLIIETNYYNGETVPTLMPTKKVVNTDRIIDCVSTHANCNGSSIKLHRSQCSNIICCQIGDNWSVYPSSEKCKEAQAKENQTQGNNNQNNTSIMNCSYHYGEYGYDYGMMTPIECIEKSKAYWDGLNSAVPTYKPKSYATPTMSQEQAEEIINQHNSQVQQCRNNVISEYNGLLQSCNQYGGSSSAEACRKIYGEQKQSAYNNCGQLY